MTDKRLTDNEIIKALMCFSFWHEGCEKCPYLKRCNKVKRMLTIIDTIDALALINRQNAEIERLQDALIDNEYANCVAVKNGLIYTRTLDDYDKLIGDISADAIKEFAERLKNKASDFGFVKAVWGAYIDNLVKEMVGDDNA